MRSSEILIFFNIELSEFSTPKVFGNFCLSSVLFKPSFWTRGRAETVALKIWSYETTKNSFQHL